MRTLAFDKDLVGSSIWVQSAMGLLCHDRAQPDADRIHIPCTAGSLDLQLECLRTLRSCISALLPQAG